MKREVIILGKEGWSAKWVPADGEEDCSAWYLYQENTLVCAVVAGKPDLVNGNELLMLCESVYEHTMDLAKKVTAAAKSFGGQS